jgi:carbon storage regulator
MLQMTWKIGETIILDDGIEITITDIQGNYAKIGIDAPKEVKIYREEEIYEGTPNYLAPPYG